MGHLCFPGESQERRGHDPIWVRPGSPRRDRSEGWNPIRFGSQVCLEPPWVSVSLSVKLHLSAFSKHLINLILNLCGPQFSRKWDERLGPEQCHGIQDARKGLGRAGVQTMHFSSQLTSSLPWTKATQNNRKLRTETYGISPEFLTRYVTCLIIKWSP